MRSSRGGPPKKGLETRVPEAKKYAHIQARLSTGPTQNKVKYLTNNQVLRRRDETFLRISRDELAELFEEYEKHDDERVQSNVHGGDDGGPRVCVYDEDAKVAYDRPYLILDVRGPEAYDACHILQARSMPQRHLMQDKMHAEMYQFRNLDGKLIILYDDAERLAAAAAHQLVHRGFSNVFVLSRGILAFAEAFPAYVEGDTASLAPPDPPLAATAQQSARGHGTARSARGSAAATAAAPGSRAGTDVSSRMSELSVADTVISRATTRKSRC
ncbi:hypothetical protein CTAYLR_000193 [Chrysophaeum taylorii]|uniref:Rhodanese domain-containing protein n=1 Tax=Chrysophaeum taylorii TaxID=2483200 RepID=A0AAD7XM58_9STRA|nr:hypothetical protein CTAYLR_000193 [Chrysophaeum taylorii]